MVKIQETIQEIHVSVKHYRLSKKYLLKCHCSFGSYVWNTGASKRCRNFKWAPFFRKLFYVITWLTSTIKFSLDSFPLVNLFWLDMGFVPCTAFLIARKYIEFCSWFWQFFFFPTKVFPKTPVGFLFQDRNMNIQFFDFPILKLSGFVLHIGSWKSQKTAIATLFLRLSFQTHQFRWKKSS